MKDSERNIGCEAPGRGENDIILVPQPTNDPSDPLNWNKLRKEYHFWLLWIWGFIATVSVNWVGPVWTQLTINLNTTFSLLNVSSALGYLFLGIGCVLLQPNAMKIGRRPVYIFGTLLNVIGFIVGGIQDTVEQFFGVSVLTGLGAALVDSLVQISTTDIFFAHQKGTRLSLLVFTLKDQYTSEETSTTLESKGKEATESVEPAQDPVPPAPNSYWKHMGLFNIAHADSRPLWLNFSISNVGNINFAAFIGGILGMMWGGFVSDWCILYFSRRNKGILEPKFRLWTMVIPAIVNTAGLLMQGLGALSGVMWIMPAGFGMVFIAFGIGSGAAIAITYAIDCYPKMASEALVFMLFLRSFIGSGFTFAIQPWLQHDGLQNTTIIMSLICFVSNISFLLFTWKGKAFREWTAVRYLEAQEKQLRV
ncbi:hypothetical protein H104_01223 [Trichophyton rubrum CBS 289.86]|nr:hypothetical protein H104_01223 [Trichophyton rubrum CBS 289.86]